MFLIAFTLVASLALGLALPVSEVEAEWEKFQDKFDRHFEDPEELANRKIIFAHNLEEILKHNADYEAGKSSFQKGVNRFTDRTTEEIESLMGLRIPSIRDLQKRRKHQVDVLMLEDANTTESLDYRKLGAVTPVKDQENCGSCWAFSAVGSIESSYFLTTKKLVSFSEQQLVDCSKSNNGCDGGLMDRAFDDINVMGGITTSDKYIYEGRDEDCKLNKTMAVAQIPWYITFPGSDTTILKNALSMLGPLSIAVEANDDFMSYKKGVWSGNNCSGQLNHGVLLVGYGSENGTDYWIVKNSWGKNWGEEGYIRLNRAKENCVQPWEASIPIVTPIA